MDSKFVRLAEGMKLLATEFRAFKDDSYIFKRDLVPEVNQEIDDRVEQAIKFMEKEETRLRD